MIISSPDLKRAGLRPARPGGSEGQPGGGSCPRRPGRVRRPGAPPAPSRGVGMARRGCEELGVPPSPLGGDTAPSRLK